MPPSAPRLPQRLLDVVERLASRQVPIAEINRLVGAEAERMGLPRPSYQRVRQLVHEARAIRARPTRTRVAVDYALRARSQDELLSRLADGPRGRLRDRIARQPSAK
jgi:hypothetical protein